VTESEFARTLKVMGRQGNTLSPIVREAWDTGDLRVMTKNSAAVATGAHIVLTGDITIDELKRELADTETVNGFANRFVWLLVRRSKLLPEPPPFGGEAVTTVIAELAQTLQFARDIGELRRDDDARTLWAEVYAELSREDDGLAASILARAEAHVLRLSLLYALLDCSTSVTVEHLTAALELWGYAERSAAYIFGDATGDPVADTIRQAIAANGEITRTEITNLFGRHESSTRIASALHVLLTSGKARMVTREPEGGVGRRVEVWHAVV
jgi:hypothetical protein